MTVTAQMSGSVVVTPYTSRLRALAPHAAQKHHEGSGPVPRLRHQLGFTEVGLAVGKMAGIDDIEATPAVEEDPLQRQFVLGGEVFHLGRQVHAHAEVPSRCVGCRRSILPAWPSAWMKLTARSRGAIRSQ